jgi:hypothetical protein
VSTHVSDRRSLGHGPGRCATGWSGRGARGFHRYETFAYLVGGRTRSGAVCACALNGIRDLIQRRAVGIEQRQNPFCASKRPARNHPTV